jgi:5-methylcytosine-specific restriction endonuclease McrA
MSKTYVSQELRQLVRTRAQGRCEYCLISESVTFATHEVDHIVAEKHGGSTSEDNLALCCTLCNLHKGTDLTSIDPETNEIMPLFHPRKHQWADHFQIVDGRLEPRSPTGRVTVRLLQLNQANRVEERKLLLSAGLFDIPEQHTPPA